MVLISRFLPHLILVVLPKVTLCLEELVCNFSEEPGGIHDAYVSICTRRMTLNTKIDIICPKRVEGPVNETTFLNDNDEYETVRMSEEFRDLAEYIVKDGLKHDAISREDGENYRLFPQNPGERVNLMISDQLVNAVKQQEVGFWEVFGTSGETIISKREDPRREIIKMEPPGNGLLTVKTSNKVLFFCMKETYLDKINDRFLKFISNWAFLPTDNEYTKLHIPVLDYGNRDIRAGVAVVVLTDLVLMQHGCSNMPNIFFFNPSDLFPGRNYYQCVFDVMTNPNLGLFCDGAVEPNDCFASFKSFRNGQFFRMPIGSLRESGYVGTSIAFGSFNREHIYTPFRGYCDCKDLNGRLLARIIVERKKEHTCNITNMLLKNSVQPFRDLWFDVNLHPGDSLTILFPPNIDNTIFENMRRQGLLGQRSRQDESAELQEINVVLDVDDVQHQDEQEGGAEQEDEQGISSDIDYSDSDVDDPGLMDQHVRELNVILDSEGSESEPDSEGDTPSLPSNDSDSADNIENLHMPQNDIPNVAISAAPEGFNFPFSTYFSPHDLKNKIITFLYSNELVNQVDINSVFVGGAYRVDTSNYCNGEIKIEYLPTPLGKKRMCEYIYYHWILKYRSTMKPEILAKIRVSLSETYTYTRGCETQPTGIFFPSFESPNCIHHFNRCKRRGVKHYIYNMSDHFTYGIKCSDTEHLFPPECGLFMVRGKTNRIEPVDNQILAFDFPNLRQFLLLKKRHLMSDQVPEYHCSCIDNSGLEKSRLTLYKARTRLVKTDGFGYGTGTRFIVLIGKVLMALPPFNAHEIRRLSCYTNTLPEPEYVPVPYGVYPQQFDLRVGCSYKVSCVTPEPLEDTTKVYDAQERPWKVSRNLTLDGVRHNDDISELDDYTDPSKSPERLFPVNITKYFYQKVESRDVHYIPVEYNSILSTNVTGFRISVKTINSSSPIPEYRDLYIDIPDSSIIVIKDDTKKTLRMSFISGAISKPGRFTPEKSEKTEDAKEEDEVEQLGEVREIQQDPEIAELGQLSEVQEEPEPSTSKESGNKLGIKAGGKRPKRGRKRKRREEPRRIERDVRGMEVWGIYTFILKGTHPYARGCGVTEMSEDFFKPETEEIIENNRVVGCKVDLRKHKIAGFYCPKPYIPYPPRCFRYMAFDDFVEWEMPEEVFETSESTDNGLMIIKLKRGARADLDRIMMKRGVYQCYCVTMGGAIRSRIEITI